MAVFQMPAQDHLSRCLAVNLRDIEDQGMGQRIALRARGSSVK